MAAEIVKIRIHGNGSIQEISIYNPSINLLWSDSESDSLSLSLGITGYPLVTFSFPAKTCLDAFVLALDSALSTAGSGTVTLENTCTQSSTTTTTSALTTTTTTASVPTTTDTPITTTTTSGATTTTTLITTVPD